MIIDTHAHIFPAKIAFSAVEATAKFYLGGNTPSRPTLAQMLSHGGTPEELLVCAKRAGIDRMVVSSTATSSKQVAAITDFIGSQCALHPEFIGLGSMHIDYPDFETECERMRSLGLHGIKLHPDIQRFAVDDRRMLPLYEIMQAKNMFLLSHTGDTRFDFSGPRRMLRLAEMFPRMNFVCAHFAGWSEWELARKILRRDNIYMDTSSTIGFSGPETAKKAFSVFDPSHIFFGTDYPMWDPESELETIRSLGLPEDVLEGVLGKNFERFYARYRG